MKYIPILLLILPILLLSSCLKTNKQVDSEVQTLPPITSEGLNTFGCLLNGEVWLPESHNTNIFGSMPEIHSTYYSKNYLQVLTKKDPKDKAFTSNINFKIRGDVSTGKYWFQNDSYETYAVYTFFTDNSNNYYITAPSKNSWVDIKYLDTAARIAAGTFSMDLVNQNDSLDTVYVRDGRFDVFLYEIY